MPAFVNSNVGSLPGTSELDGTAVWPRSAKKFRNAARSSALVIRCCGARIVLLVMVSVGALFVVVTGAKGGPDLVRGKPTILEEPCLFCTFAVVARNGRAESPASGRPGGFRPIDLTGFQRGIDGLGADASLPQILAYSHRARDHDANAG